MNHFHTKKLCLSVAIAGVMSSGLAYAAIDEIVVTANKREQTLQDIPLTVSVTSGETIQQSSIVDLIDLQSAVPSLRVNQLQSSAQTNFTIRGFGNGANNPGIEPAVSVVIDGVSRSRSASSLSDLPTIERVEVLSGPQSTLFGKNASAGVISVSTMLPEQELGGMVEATAGNYGTQIVKGTVTGGISDTLSYRLSGSTNQSDGTATNLGTSPGSEDDSGVNNRDRSALRGQLLWEPSEDLSVRFIVDQDSIDEECCVAGALLKGPASGVSDGIAAMQGFGTTDGDPWSRAIYMNHPASNVVDNDGVSIQVDYEMDFADLTSITSQRQTTLDSNFDADFSAAKLISENLVQYEFDTFTQELRLTSNGDASTQWMLGAFYAEEDTTTNRTVRYGDDIKPYVNFLLQGAGTNLLGIAELVAAGALAQVIGAQGGDPSVVANMTPAMVDAALADAQAAGAPVMTSTQMESQFFIPGSGSVGEGFEMNAKTLSLFANVDYQLAEDLTATVGFNYTEDEKTVVTDVIVQDFFSTLPLPAALASVQFFPPFVNFPNTDEDGIFNSDDLTHTLRLAYDFSEDTKMYVAHSTGFKPTSVNLSVNANNAQIGRAADPEESENFELGVKHVFGNGYLNIAYFDQSIDGFQSNTFIGNGFALVNAGEQNHKGFEFDAMVALSESLVVNVSGIKVDAEYVSFMNGSCGDFEGLECDEGKSTRDLSGTIPAGVHDWSINANAVYSFDLNDSVSGFFRAEYIYETEVPLVDNVPVSLASRGTKNVNLSLGLNHDASGLEAMFWARNITDHETLISAFPTTAAPGSFSAYPNAPRTYGLTLRKNF
ncbi:MAG: TonB-dependent receptor [Porticoccaceae bacterium]|nr:TonB-dependent receptor [Porticoccaceae bacterium]